MAFLDPAINFGDVQVSTGYDAAATSIVLTGSEGAKLPSTFSYNMTWWNYTDYPNPKDDPNREIVRVTARSTDTLTVTRAQEGTTATTKNTASKTYRMALVPTKKLIDDIEAYLQGKAAADLASATTTDIGAVTGTYVKITGTTTITGLGSAVAGTTRIVSFGGILTLTHNVTAIVLPTAANITTAAGDRAIFVSESPGVWLCVSYLRADGTALAAASGGSATAIDTTTSAWITTQLPKSDLLSGTHTWSGAIDAFNSSSSDGQAIQWYLPTIRTGTNQDGLRMSEVKRVIMRVVYKGGGGSSLIGFGFAEQGSYLGDAHTVAGNRVGFTWSGTTTLYAVTSDGSGTPTATDVTSGITATNSNEYIVDWDDEAGNAKFYINGTLVATHTTEIPSTTEPCRAAFGVGGAGMRGLFSYPIVSIKMT